MEKPETLILFRKKNVIFKSKSKKKRKSGRWLKK